MFRNKFNPKILAVVLIALLCFFLPDVKAQTKTNINIYVEPDSTYIKFEKYLQRWLGESITEFRNEQCDTLKATYSDMLGNYLVEKKNYTEAYSKEQLEQKGYKYKYRWVMKVNPIELEYIFIKEPTLEEFGIWLKLQGKK
jgi:hypothetical protein